MLYFLIVDSRLQFTQTLIFDVASDRSSKGALALTERDRYMSSRSQLCGFHGALWAVLPGLVLPSPLGMTILLVGTRPHEDPPCLGQGYETMFRDGDKILSMKVGGAETRKHSSPHPV